MAEQASKSSSESWHDAISTWEKSFNSMANATMANDEFSGVMNQAMKLTLLMQQSLGNVMAVYLSTMNLPSKTDVAALGERLQSVEARLDRMTALLEHLLATRAPSTGAPDSAAAGAPHAAPPAIHLAPPSVAMPPRTKRAPGRSKNGKK